MELSTQETNSTEDVDFPEKRRKVRWSVELEEVHYFVPLPQKSESRWRKKMKNLKEKAHDLKYKPLLLLWDREAIHLFQSGLESFVKKINLRSETLDLENIRAVNDPWDELFELYTERGELSNQKIVDEPSEDVHCGWKEVT